MEKEQILLLLRLHIKEATAAEDFVNSRIRCFGSKEVGDVTGMLGMFDLLITDYSSIYIDYLLTDKPMIFLPYDKERYLDGRGMNFDYEEVTPGPKPKTMKEFTEELRAYRKTLVNRTKGNTRRFLKAYPHLNRGYRMRHKKDKK